MKNFTPREIVSELDKYIVGQNQAKKMVAIALRNRWRRRQVPDELKDEIAPKNIIMIGPTGVGKTEIARRLAKLAQSPFLKVEASKFTEVGYVGRDVESMIRDLIEIGINMVKDEEYETLRPKAEQRAEDRLLDHLLPTRSSRRPRRTSMGVPIQDPPEDLEVAQRTRDKFRKMLRNGKLNDREVEIETQTSALPIVEVLSPAGMEGMDINFKDMFSSIFPTKTKHRKVSVPEAMSILIQEELDRIIDTDKVTKMAKERVEQTGIVFIDELDKVAGTSTDTAPTSHGKGSNVTCCRSSKVARSTRNTGRSGPTTSCSWQQARFMCPSLRTLFPNCRGGSPSGRNSHRSPKTISCES